MFQANLTLRRAILTVVFPFPFPILSGAEPEGRGGRDAADRPHPRPEATRQDRPDRRLRTARGVQGNLHFSEARRHGAVERSPEIPQLSPGREGGALAFCEVATFGFVGGVVFVRWFFLF